MMPTLSRSGIQPSQALPLLARFGRSHHQELSTWWVQVFLMESTGVWYVFSPFLVRLPFHNGSNFWTTMNPPMSVVRSPCCPLTTSLSLMDDRLLLEDSGSETL